MYGEMWQIAAGRTHEAFPAVDVSSREFATLVGTEFFRSASTQGKQEHDASYRKSTHNVDSILSLSEEVYSGFYALLKSTVIQAWMAFEVLTEDLHIEARNQHPKWFSTNLLSEKYYFRRLDAITGSYLKGFSNDGSINAALDNSDVKGLALTRHLLVHKNGKVDKQHIDARNQSPKITILDAFPKNSTIQLDGEIVRSLVDSVTQRAHELLWAVDNWLESHKPI